MTHGVLLFAHNNDVVDYVREKGMKINKLDNYFSSSILDLVDLWKRTITNINHN